MRKILFAASVWLVSITASAQFRHNLDTQACPWTSEPLINGSQYSFVILADRTGGPRYEVFQKAVGEVNNLSPDFVMTVGDLIDGYVKNVEWSARQWDDLMNAISVLKAPVFFTGGNHDLSNPMMIDDYKKRFGSTYYHFHIGEDLFLVLDTEEQGGRPVSKEQVSYFSDVLKDWDGRWIYVFMHSPLWEGDGKGGYEEISSLLKGHDYTVFSGHVHQYYKEVKDGMEHYILATTGGSSGLRGKAVGEFDHYMHVTACDSGPKIRNILVGGEEISPDIVNPATKPYVDVVLGSSYAHIYPVLLKEKSPAKFSFRIKVRNPLKKPMVFSADMTGIKGLETEPTQIRKEILPETTEYLDVLVSNPSQLPCDSFPPMDLVTSCGYDIEGEDVELYMKRRVLVDYVRDISTFAARVDVSNPDLVREDWCWADSSDGKFMFTIKKSEENVNIFVRTSDDVLVTSEDPFSPQDRISIILDSDRIGVTEWRFRPYRKTEIIGALKEGTVSSCIAEDNNLIAQLSVPLAVLSDTIRVNIAFTDSDNPQNIKPSVLWWKPIWGTWQEFKDAGRFVVRRQLPLEVDSTLIKVFMPGETPKVRVSGSGIISVSITQDIGEPICSMTKQGDEVYMDIPLDVAPGFYKVNVSDQREEKSYVFGFNPEEIASPPILPDDFDSFWTAAKEELKTVNPKYRVRVDKKQSGICRDLYHVTMKSLGNETISAYYAVPKKKGIYPAVAHFIGYGSDPWIPDLNSSEDKIELVLSHRGQGLNKNKNRYGQWITSGIESPYTYYYRGAYMDAVRAIDFLSSRPEVDKSRIFAQGGSQGGALALAVSALDDRVAAVASSVPFMSDFPDYFSIAPWPGNIVKKVCGPELTYDQVLSVLAYFDIKNLATHIKCPVMMAFGLQDNICPPHTNFAGYNNITSQKDWIVYPYRAHDVWKEKSLYDFVNSFFEKSVR